MLDECVAVSGSLGRDDYMGRVLISEWEKNHPVLKPDRAQTGIQDSEGDGSFQSQYLSDMNLCRHTSVKRFHFNPLFWRVYCTSILKHRHKFLTKSYSIQNY